MTAKQKREKKALEDAAKAVKAAEAAGTVPLSVVGRPRCGKQESKL